MNNLKPIYHSHDHTFKAVLGFPKARKQLLQQHLPEAIKEKIDFTSLKLEKQSFIEPDLQAKIVDILISVKLKHNQKPAYIYILFEHQSTADQNMPLRIREYNVKILKMYKKEHPKDKLPVLTNLLFYHGRPSPYPYTLNLYDQFTDPELVKTYLDKIILIDIKQIPDEVLLERAWSGLYSLFAKQSQEKKPAMILKQASIIIRKLEKEEHALEFIELLFHYLIQNNDQAEPEELKAIIKKDLSGTITGERIMTIAERFVAQGLQQGMQQGMQRGMQQGMQRGKLEVAKNLFIRGMDHATIAEITGCSIADIKKL